MKKKDIKKIAQKIAEAEYVIQTSNDHYACAEAQKEIINLTNKIDDLDAMCEIDDMVQEILKNFNV